MVGEYAHPTGSLLCASAFNLAFVFRPSDLIRLSRIRNSNFNAQSAQTFTIPSPQKCKIPSSRKNGVDFKVSHASLLRPART